MEQQPTLPTRKKVLLWGVSIIASLTALKFLSSNKKKKIDTVKMLTQDGKLVEVDKSLLSTASKKISNKELQQWIKK